MFLYVQHDDDVAWLQVGLLVPLAGEHDALAVQHSLLDVHLEDLPVADRLLAVARFAAVLGVDDLALALTHAADLFVLLHEARHDLLDLDLHSLALTRAARVHRALLTATALALLADDALLQRQLPHGAVVDLFERHLHLVDQVLSFTFALAKIE